MIASAVFVLVATSCFGGALATPVSQPTYPTNQYYAVPQQYLQQIQQQQSQPRYISAPQAYEGGSQQQVSQQYPSAPSPPTQRVSQLLLPSAADRQVQKAAEQIAGPEYAQQVQIAQQQGLADQALATAQRRAQAQFRRAQMQGQQQVYQPQPQQQQQAYSQPQQQYVEISPKQQYIRIQVPQHIAEQAQQYQLQYEPVYPQPTQQKNQRAAPQPQEYAANQVQRGKERQEEPEHDTNSSYQFGFDVKDDLYTNYQNRKEQREGGKISGSYSVVDSDGFIRTVTYTADPKEGFKAEVVRKPTDIVVKIPQPKEQKPQPQQQQQQQQPEPHQQYIQEVPAQRYQPQPQYQHQQQQPQQQQKPNIVYQYQ